MIETEDQGERPFVFVSYVDADRAWGEWLAWQLEATGLAVRTYVWEAVPGSNRISLLDQMTSRAERAFVLLSPAYLAAEDIATQWQAFHDASSGTRSKLVPVRVAPCNPPGLLKDLVPIDLVGLTEQAATDALLRGVAEIERGSRRPTWSDTAPPYPNQTALPGRASDPDEAAVDARHGFGLAAGGPPQPAGLSIFGSVRTTGSPEDTAPSNASGAIRAPETATRSRRRTRAGRLFTRPAGRAALAVLAVLAVTAATLTGVRLAGDDRSAEASPEAGTEHTFNLEPAGQPTIDWFMTSVGRDSPDVGPAFGDRPAAEATPHPSGGPTPADSGGVGGGVVPAETTALFGGTRDNATCDRAAMVEFLERRPNLLEVWTDVLEIETTMLREFVDSLTPVVLRADTLVTNHGLRDGKARAYQAVLEAGTAVLVDRAGTPVVKCACGNPLKRPELTPTTAQQASPVGVPWAGFSQRAVVEIAPAPVPIQVFVLATLDAAEFFSRIAGTAGDADHDFRASVDTDWHNTTYTVDCGGPLTVEVDEGYGEAVRDGTTWTLRVIAYDVGDLVGGSPSYEAAVLLSCGQAQTDNVARFVQVYRDGPNLLAALTPPTFPVHPVGVFGDVGFAIKDNTLTTPVRYADSEIGYQDSTQRTLRWAWQDGRFIPQVVDETTVTVPGPVTNLDADVVTGPAAGETNAVITWDPPAGADADTVQYVVVLENGMPGYGGREIVVSDTTYRTGCCAGRAPYFAATVAARTEAGTRPPERVSFQ